MRGRYFPLLLVALLPLGFAGIWRLQQRIDVTLAGVEQEQDSLLLRSPKLMKLASMEFAPLLADVYWTRAVQYYGNKRLTRGKGLDLLWPFLDIATTLDPQLIPAYRFGSTFLSERQPAGAGHPELAVQLLERGIKANPDYWRLYADLGYVYYFDAKDYRKASQAFYQGSKNPQALIWMKVMAAKIAAEGESLGTSKFLWLEVYRTTNDPELKKNAENHLKDLQIDEDLAQLSGLSKEFERRTGHKPREMRELVEAGLLRGIPRDREGYPYVLDGEGKAQLNLNSPLLEDWLLKHRK